MIIDTVLSFLPLIIGLGIVSAFPTYKFKSYALVTGGMVIVHIALTAWLGYGWGWWVPLAQLAVTALFITLLMGFMGNKISADGYFTWLLIFALYPLASHTIVPAAIMFMIGSFIAITRSLKAWNKNTAEDTRSSLKDVVKQAGVDTGFTTRTLPTGAYLPERKDNARTAIAPAYLSGAIIALALSLLLQVI